MKKIITLSLIITAFAVTFSSCSKENQLKKRLATTWSIDKIEAVITPTGGGAAQPFTFTNCGTFTFKSDGTGSSSLTLGGSTQNNTFNWSNTATTVTITESGQTPSIMTVSINEKTKQVWTSTESDNASTTVYTYTLSKK